MFHVDHQPTHTNRTYLTTSANIGGHVPELYLATLGRFSTAGRFKMEQVSKSVAVHVVRSGKGVMRVGDRTFDVGRGDVFTFFPGWHIRYNDFPQSPWRYTWLVLGGSSAIRAIGAAGITEQTPHLHRAGIADAMEPVFADVMRTYRAADVPAVSASAAAWRIVETLSAALSDRSRTTTSDDIAAKARFLVDHSYMRLNGVEDIARQFGVSRITLFRQFRAAYDTSPKAYLDGVRLEQARRLLTAGDMSVKQIAAACGYRGSHYFCRAFRKHHGKPPGAWRMALAEAAPKTTRPATRSLPDA